MAFHGCSGRAGAQPRGRRRRGLPRHCPACERRAAKPAPASDAGADLRFALLCAHPLADWACPCTVHARGRGRAPGRPGLPTPSSPIRRPRPGSGPPGLALPTAPTAVSVAPRAWAPGPPGACPPAHHLPRRHADSARRQGRPGFPPNPYSLLPPRPGARGTSLRPPLKPPALERRHLTDLQAPCAPPEAPCAPPEAPLGPRGRLRAARSRPPVSLYSAARLSPPHT